VPHVGGKPGQEGLDVGPLAVPLNEPVHGESVSEIVDPNVERTVAGLSDADRLAGPPKGLLHSLGRQETSHAGREQRPFVRAPGDRLGLPEEGFQEGRQGRADGHDPRLKELRIPDGDEPTLEVQILPSEADGLARSEPEGVDGEEDRAQYLGGHESAGQAGPLRSIEDLPDFLPRIDVRLELPLGPGSDGLERDLFKVAPVLGELEKAPEALVLPIGHPIVGPLGPVERLADLRSDLPKFEVAGRAGE
jgi:hypothetical protein